MNITIDTSALIAVIVDEPEREKIIEVTIGNELIAPSSIPWEIGNAFSAMFKQGRLDFTEAKKGLEIFESIPIRYVKTDFVNSISIAKQANIYAYDAYLLDCATRMSVPILTLDKKLRTIATSLKIQVIEV